MSTNEQINSTSDTITQELSSLRNEIRRIVQFVQELKTILNNCNQTAEAINDRQQLLKSSLDILSVEVDLACSQIQDIAADLRRERLARTVGSTPPHYLTRVSASDNRPNLPQRIIARALRAFRTNTIRRADTGSLLSVEITNSDSESSWSDVQELTW